MPQGVFFEDMSFDVVADIIQIIFADIVLSGDNALVIGMAAAGLSVKLRKRAIFIGLALAAGLRILFAITASYLLAIKGILLIGAVLLAWVCWRFYHDLKAFNDPSVLDIPDGDGQTTPEGSSGAGADDTKFSRALFTILMADVSMSIDNIVAVAAIARDNTTLLVFGLALAIAFMAFFASFIMRVMLTYRWLSWLGLLLLVYLTMIMLHDGLVDVGIISSVFV